MADDVKRRDVLILGAAALVAGGHSAKAAEGRFFNAREFALLEQLAELIVPADEISAGAKQAGVAAYIDARFAESLEEEEKQRWRKGLELFDGQARTNYGKDFVDIAPAEQILVVGNAADPAQSKTPDGIFFSDLKASVVYAFYTSKIGIHNALEYRGNVYQRGEYSGYLPEGPALPFPK